jgi:hypothetical protein
MANTQAAPAPTKVITGEVRLSYTQHLFEVNEDGKFSVLILIPKSDKATVAKINAAIEAVKANPASLSTWASAKVPVPLKTPLRDGDTERDVEASPEYAGHYFMNVSTKLQPGLVDAAVAPILNRAELYSGCYGRVSLNFYAYNSEKGGKGISGGLNNVQKLRDGDSLGGSVSKAEDDFGPAADDDFLG